VHSTHQVDDHQPLSHRFLCQKILGSRNLKDRQVLRPSTSSINLQRERYPPHQIGTGLGGLRGWPERELDPEHWPDSTTTQKRLSAQ
jgi:hypothetical protein